MAKKKPQSVNIYIPFQAKAQGHLLLRSAQEGLRILDVFPNRRRAKPYLLAQERESGALRLKKLRVFDLAHSMSALPKELSVDMIVFEGQTFPLTEPAVAHAIDGPWAPKELWEKAFEIGDTRALAFATSWWWLSMAHGYHPLLTKEILDEIQALNLVEAVADEPLAEELRTETPPVTEDPPPEESAPAV